MKQEAMSLYTAPFRYCHGYIWDANGEMVADSPAENVVLRIRGWGRLSYLANSEELQDTIGEMTAQALTEFWEKNK